MTRGNTLTILAIKHIADSAAACRIHLVGSMAVDNVRAAGCALFCFFRLAARRAAVGKTRFVGPELKLFVANDAGANRKRHSKIIPPSTTP
jgi:hypothetical protein